MANDFNEITNRLHSVRISDDPSTDHIVSGADEVYDDTAPYRTNGHIICNEITPEGTENPKELNWYEKVVDATDPTLFEWIRTNDETVDASKTYGIPTGAKQNDINNQLYTMIGDISSVTIESGEVVIADESKIINKEDGYIPTAGAVGRALGANFENKLNSTSVTQGLTANMGRVLNEKKADINGYYETMSVGSANNLDGESTNDEAYLIRPTGGENNEVTNGLASVVGMEGVSQVWNQKVVSDYKSGSNSAVDTRNNEIAQVRLRNRVNNSILTGFYITSPQRKAFIVTIPSNCTQIDLIRNGQSNTFNIIPSLGIISSHKYYFVVDFKTVDYQTIGGYTWDNVQCIDLTILGIDNLTTVAQVEEWLAQHVGIKSYYAYNAGEILSAKTLGIKTYNRNLLNPTTKQAKLIPYTHTTNSNKYTVKNIPTDATLTYTPYNTNTAIDVTSEITDDTLDITSYGIGILELSAIVDNTYVCMKYDGSKDNDIVPYKASTFNFDVTKVYGKVNGEGDYVQCFPNGIRSAGSVHDTLTASKAVVKTYLGNLGNINYNHISDGIFYTPGYANIIKKPSTDVQRTVGLLSSLYLAVEGHINNSLIQNLEMYKHPNGNLYLKNISYNDPTNFKNAMIGVYVCFERATPITYTDLIYRDNGIDTPFKDILMNINVNNWSMEEQLLPDYVDDNPTSVPAKISTIYSIDAVAAIDELQKKSYFEGDVHDNLQAMLACINTNCSTILGGTFGISSTATNKLFEFSFTPTESTNTNDVEPTTEGE